MYLICDRDKKRYYVGCSSSNCLSRVFNHIHKLKTGTHPSDILQKAYQNGHKLEFVQLLELPDWKKEDILDLERRLIFGLKTYDDEYGFNVKNVPPETYLERK
ncbi:hypothetical protein [Mesobacillus persicus]|uniref:hypothetical protein n=1 Tax=Mesobacillus persicus TaxID=930146 RepID=UPI00244E9953|nr:hypothetical protein [Mesobacillus persicus]